jgi:hypothetical protein
MSINPNTIPDNPEIHDINTNPENIKNNKQIKNVGKGSLENSEGIKYSYNNQKLEEVNKLNTQPVLDKPLSKQEFTLAKQQLDDASKFLNDINTEKGKFLQEVNSGKISPETKAQLEKNLGYLRSAKNYMEYLSGKNVNSNFGKSVILSGMGLNKEQQNDALLSLNKKQQLESLYNKHGGENKVNDKLSKLQSMGFNKQQALAILSLSPENTSNIALQGNKQQVLKSLGFTKQQTDNLLKLIDSNTFKFPNNKNLLNKAGFDNNTIGVLQALSNSKAISNQEFIIPNSTTHGLSLLDDITDGFDKIQNHQPIRGQGYNNSMSLYYAALLMIQKSIANRREQERNASFQQGMAAVEEKKIQADLEREAGYQQFVGEMVQASVQFAAAAVQMKMMTTTSASGPALQAYTAKAQALSSAMNAMGDATKAVFNFEATKTRAEAKDSEAKEKLHDIYHRESDSFIQNLTSHIEDVRKSMQEAERSNSETLSRINNKS